MNKRIYGAIVCMGMASPLVAIADSETLTYTGTAFDQASFSGNLQQAEANAPLLNTGTITLAAPLGDNLTNVVVTPAAYSFDSSSPIASLYLSSDNPFTKAATFEFSTNASGQITQWNVDVSGGIFGGTNSPSGAMMTLGNAGDTFSAFTSTPSCASPRGGNCFNISESNTDQAFSAGSWQASVAEAPEIDPASALSGLTLLGGCLLMLRGRKRAAA